MATGSHDRHSGEDFFITLGSLRRGPRLDQAQIFLLVAGLVLPILAACMEYYK